MNIVHNSNVSLNARNSPLEQVATSFVPNEEYSEVRRACHTVVLGPRGSGKTTLFKMLTGRAIAAWNDDSSSEHPMLPATPFLAIYIPADIHWNKQIAAIWAGGEIEEGARMALARAALNIGILRSAVEAIADELRENDEAANEVSVALASVLKLPVKFAGFAAVRIAIASARMEVSRLCNASLDGDFQKEELSNLPELCSADYLPMLSLIKEVVIAVTKGKIARVWALCFDELEICPDWLQRMIVGEMRSTDQDFLFKLSASPIPDNFSETFADHLNDFKVVKMWPFGGKKEDRFSETLARSWLARKSINLDPRVFIRDHDKLPVGYEEGQEGFEIIAKVSRVDHAISEYLQSKDIDSNRLEEATQEQKDSVLRKLRPVCLFRAAFRDYSKRAGKKKIVEKTLKRPPAIIFSGFDQILLISDFNPRRLVLILERLVEESTVDGVLPHVIPIEIQMRVVYNIGHEFSAYVASFPESACMISSRKVSLINLLREIADFFRNQLMGPDVNIDPVGCFSIPEGLSKTNSSLCEMLRKAAWLGAIVNIDAGTKSNPLDGTVERRAFRISYTLAPVFGLLLRASKARSVQHCLRHKYTSLEPIESRDDSGEQTEFQEGGF